MSCEIGTDIERAVELIRAGGLVAFATETVYGLGTNALNANAVARIFEAKQRPLYDPLICHVSDQNMVSQLSSQLGGEARLLMDQFWPGPLSILLPKGPMVPDLVSAGLDTVAVRMPAHRQANQLLAAAGVPIAAPSANLFGRVSPTTALHVASQLGDRIDYILDGGPCEVGVESTVVQVVVSGGDTVLEILRPGGTTIEDLRSFFPAARHSAEGQHPVLKATRAPGMLPRHYAPETRIEIVEEVEDLEWEGTEVLLSGAPVSGDLRPPGPGKLLILSESGDLRECAAAFFAALRSIDDLSASKIVARPFPNEGLGMALNDRLQRASR